MRLRRDPKHLELAKRFFRRAMRDTPQMRPTWMRASWQALARYVLPEEVL